MLPYEQYSALMNIDIGNEEPHVNNEKNEPSIESITDEVDLVEQYNQIISTIELYESNQMQASDVPEWIKAIVVKPIFLYGVEMDEIQKC